MKIIRYPATQNRPVVLIDHSVSYAATTVGDAKVPGTGEMFAHSGADHRYKVVVGRHEVVRLCQIMGITPQELKGGGK